MSPEESLPNDESRDEVHELAANIAAEVLRQIADSLESGSTEDVQGLMIPRIGMASRTGLGFDCTGPSFTCGSYTCQGTHNCGGNFACNTTFAGLTGRMNIRR